MVKLVGVLWLLIASASYLGPVAPELVHCAASAEQECQSTECADQCTLCACTLDRQATSAIDEGTARHAALPTRLRPALQELYVSPPSADILHVPKIHA